jgi:hypothetical protein
MGRASDGCAAAPPTGDAALDALQWNWGDAYTIGRDDGVWWFRRRDGWGGTVRASTPNELREAIITNYVARPVRREISADVEERRDAYEAMGVRIWHNAAGWHARWPVKSTGTGVSHPHDLRTLLDRLDALKVAAR